MFNNRGGGSRERSGDTRVLFTQSPAVRFSYLEFMTTWVTNRTLMRHECRRDKQRALALSSKLLRFATELRAESCSHWTPITVVYVSLCKRRRRPAAHAGTAQSRRRDTAEIARAASVPAARVIYGAPEWGPSGEGRGGGCGGPRLRRSERCDVKNY